MTACFCTKCQKRSGAAFAWVGRWKVEDVAVEGERKLYIRTADSGKLTRQTFCPTCGSTLLTEPEMMPGIIGVPAGCFADKDFPPPGYAGWCENQPAWIALPEGVEGKLRQ